LAKVNQATANDELTVAFWQKKLDIADSSAFTMNSPGSPNNRGFHSHTPWSNQHIYFDTVGCCDGATQRIEAGIDTFSGYSGDSSWWTDAYHLFVFTKKGASKNIWVDGKLFLSGESTAKLPVDIDAFYMGSGADGGERSHAIIDDFSVYGKELVEADIVALSKGTLPTALPAAKGLIAYWDFNAAEYDSDKDKDGMADTWELNYGFNPNDASDGAKDFDKDGVTNAQEYAAGTDPVDVTKPVLVSAATSGDFKTVTLTFSEAVEAVSAATLANYAFSPNLAVTAASVKKNLVTLTTAAQTPGAVAYTITVNNVVDTSKNAVVANSTASFYSFINVKDGVLKFSFWGNISGTPVDNLYQDPRWPASPDYTKAVYAFNSRDALPNDANDNYGASMEGYLTPTESGRYRFFIYSDDSSQFFISSDDKEANLAQVAEETGCCNFFTEPDSARTSEPVALAAGKKYFVRLVYKEGGGLDYGQIAWRKEGDATPASAFKPIPGKFLSSAVDLPADPAGAYTQVSPAANAKGVSPEASVTIKHRDGKTVWTAANVSLKYDGQTVTPTVTKDGTVITIKYTPPALSESLAVHTVSLGYLDAGGKASTYDYSFTSGAYSGSTEDKVGAYPGLMTGSSVFTADAAGATGKAGDKAINLTMNGGPVVSFNSAFLAKVNEATANDELSIAFWQKRLDIADSSAFTMNSPGSGLHRGFHAHAPWSDRHIYFDTAGCCDSATQRIEAGIDTFSGYSGESSWWTNAYHLFVFTKKGASKNIWVDGKLFLSGESTAKLPVDIDAFYMGSGADGFEKSHAIIDDFSVYGKELVEADIVALSKGTLPTALSAAKGLIAYWDFNAPMGNSNSTSLPQIEIKSVTPLGSDVFVPVTVTGFNLVETVQFTIGWDPSILEYRGVSKFGLNGMTESSFAANSQSGRTNKLSFSWDDSTLAGVTLTNGSALFNLNFKVVGNATGAANIVFENQPAELEVSSQGKTVPTRSVNGIVTIVSSLAGTVEYYANVGGKVAGVKVELSNGSVGVTDATGAFSVNYQPGVNYTLTPSYATDSPIANGVTTADITLIRRHVLGLAILDSPYKILAGDVNGSDSVTTADITLIRRLILGISTNFNSGLWRFVPSDETFVDMTRPWTAKRMRQYVSLASGKLSGQDFKAIKLGDVNGSWKAPTVTTGSIIKSKAKGRLTVGKVRAEAGEMVKIPVSLAGVNRLGSLQLTLSWDAKAASFEGVEGLNLEGLSQENLGLTQVMDGKLSLSWDHSLGRGVELVGNAELFQLKLRSKGTAAKRIEIQVSEGPTRLELTDGETEVMAGVDPGWLEIVAPGEAGSGLVNLRFVGLSADGSIQLEVRAPVGLMIGLETSDFLNSWTEVQNISGQGVNLPVAVSVKPEVTARARFWRVGVR
jgi:hypothetical protein